MHSKAYAARYQNKPPRDRRFDHGVVFEQVCQGGLLGVYALLSIVAWSGVLISAVIHW
jgi:hypothetical protein